MRIQRFSSLCLLSASLLLASSALAQDEDVTDVTANIAPTPLTLINGWSRYTGGAAPAQVEKVGGIVHFKGGISTSGNIEFPFVLPAGFRPAKVVVIPVDMGYAENGRLIISPNGSVQVQAEHSFSYAKNFTSLDAASFATSTSGFTPLTLINGWVPKGSGTGNPAVTLVNGIVHFEGAIATSGTNGYAFVLPKKFRPSHYVFAHVDLCNATNGQLQIAPSGYVFVKAESDFGNAQCFTSLDGAWFAQTNSGFTALSPVNGWIDGPASTSPAEAASIGGIVHLKGSVASGTSDVLFYMPPNLRPSTFVYVPIDLCGATKGRLTFYPSGSVHVLAETYFGDAQCFTSLDGASFVQ